jgi:hypothetical protein
MRINLQLQSTALKSQLVIAIIKLIIIILCVVNARFITVVEVLNQFERIAILG